MSQENVEIVRRGYEVWAAGDLEGVSALFAEDAEVADAGGLGVTGTGSGTRRGPEGFLRASQEILEAFAEYKVEAGKFIDVGDAVVVDVRISGRGRASGMPLETQLAHLWVLRNGKVTLGEVYRTLEEALEAANHSE